MSLKRPESSNQITFSYGAPHFFKIILENSLQEKKLRIPPKFVRNCGETLSDSVFVKLPCGTRWKMKLAKNDGKVWLEKGWPQFAKHYGIERGNIVVFRYEGNSEFHAVIFDKSTVEIDYPYIPIHFEESNIDRELQAPKREVIEEDAVEILDGFSPCSETGERSSLLCSRPPKRMKTSPIDKTQSSVSCHNEKVIENSTNNGKSESSNSKMKGKEDFPDESDRARCIERLKGREKFVALQKASNFVSKRPFFKVLIQPSHVNGNQLKFSPEFVRRYLKNKSDNVTLKVSNGRKTWLMKYTFQTYSGKMRARFLCGWTAFAQDNNLEVGDVCVFVLLKGIKVSFEVTIFRVSERPKPPISSGKREFPAESDRARCMERLKGIEKIAALQKTRDFVSRRPFFKVIIQPSYICDNRLNFPPEFVRRYLKKKSDNAILKVSNGKKTWLVKYNLEKYSGNTNAKFGRGWTAFVRDNNLEVGDVCVFVLLKGIKVSFEVKIFRVNESPKVFISSAHEGGPIHVEPGESLSNETEPSGALHDGTGMPSSCDKFPVKQTNGYISTPRKTSLVPKVSGRGRPLTSTEKATILERAHFESENPFFMVLIQPSYKSHLRVPDDFTETYIKNEGGATLSISNGRLWFVQFKKNRIKTGKFAARIRTGWNAFFEDNNLEVGDVCIFTLLSRTGISFEVSIVRAAASNACRQRSQAGASASKPNGDVRAKIEID